MELIKDILMKLEENNLTNLLLISRNVLNLLTLKLGVKNDH